MQPNVPDKMRYHFFTLSSFSADASWRWCVLSAYIHSPLAGNPEPVVPVRACNLHQISCIHTYRTLDRVARARS